MNKQNKLVTFDYEGASISFQRGDNVMINATEMAKFFGKRPIDWLQNQQAKDYLAAISKVKKSTLADLVRVTKGGDKSGTWMHEDVALEFARWLSPEFSIWCNQKIKELLRTGEVSIRKKLPSKTRVDATMAWIKGVAEVFSLDAVSQQKMYNKFAEDYDLPLLDYVKAEEGRESITRLLSMYGITMSAIEANKRLEASGYLKSQEYHKKGGKTGRYYVVTDKGKEYGDNYQDEHSPKKTQPLWYVEKFATLVQLFN